MNKILNKNHINSDIEMLTFPKYVLIFVILITILLIFYFRYFMLTENKLPIDYIIYADESHFQNNKSINE